MLVAEILNKQTYKDEVKRMNQSRLRKLIPFLLIASLLWLPGCTGQSAQKPAKKPIDTTQQKTAPPAQMQIMLTGEERLLENLLQQAEKEKLASKQAAAEAKLKAEQEALTKARAEALAKQKAEQEAQARQKAEQEAQAKQKAREETQNNNKAQPVMPGTPTPEAQETPQNQQNNSVSVPSMTEPVLAQGSQNSSFWPVAAQSVQKLNQNWNALEPQADEAGLNTTQRNNIKKALDDLTAAVNAQNTEKSLMAAIELFRQSGNLANVFSYPVPSEYFQLNYAIMMSALESEKMEWSAAEARIPRIQSAWKAVKAAAKGENASLMNQTELSIRDYEQAIRNKQAKIISTKAEVAWQNLKAVKDALIEMGTSTAGKTGE